MKVTKVSNSPISPILLLPAGRLRTSIIVRLANRIIRSAEVSTSTTSTFHEFS